MVVLVNILLNEFMYNISNETHNYNAPCNLITYHIVFQLQMSAQVFFMFGLIITKWYWAKK